MLLKTWMRWIFFQNGMKNVLSDSLATSKIYLIKSVLWPDQFSITTLFSEYSVQSGDRKSDSFTFKTFSDSDSFKPKFAIYGDFGIENHVSMFKLIQYLNASEYQMVLHIGDFAYDMNEKNGVQVCSLNLTTVTGRLA